MGDSITLADLKAAMDTILADLFTVKNKMTMMKGDKSHLSVVVNRLQSEKLEFGGSHSGEDMEKPAPEPLLPPQHQQKCPQHSPS
jgi:hypothetical protein